MDWAFTLIGRLWEKDCRTDAFRVLKTCEAIEGVPAVLAVVGGIFAAFWGEWPTWAIPAGIMIGTVVGVLLTQMGLFVVLRPTGVLLVSYIWSFIAGYGLIQITALIVVVLKRGWLAVLLWVVGMAAAFIVQQALEFAAAMRINRIVGQPFTSSEVNFFNAYRLHADRLGLTRDVTVGNEETANGCWRECLDDYASKWPEAVARFPLTQQDRALLASGEFSEVER